MQDTKTKGRGVRKAVREKRVSAIPVELMPTADVEPSANETEAFAAMVATGKSAVEATRILRPHLADTSIPNTSDRFAKKAAALIVRARESAAAASVAAHGISQAWYIGELKQMYLNTLAETSPESRFCKKYKVTETMTDAGPKTTMEIEKDAPLAILTQIGKALALDKPAPGTESEQKKAGAIVSLADFVASIVQPGSPITRRLMQGQPQIVPLPDTDSA